MNVLRGLTRRFQDAPRKSVQPGEPGICDDLQAWATSYPGAAYSPIDPAFVTTRPLPRTVDPEVHPSFAPLCSFEVPERGLVEIPRGRIRGDSGDVGFVILPDGSFAGELVAMTSEGRRVMLRGEASYAEPPPRRVVRKAGSYYPVLGLGMRHYYHWSHDIIMRMRGIAGLLPPDTQLVVPERMQPFQVETLALLGLDAMPRVPFPGGELWELEKLYVVKPTLKTQIDSPVPYEWFRKATMERYGLREQRQTRRLYLDRNADGHWRVTNDADVRNVLARYGFEPVAPAALSFREQAVLFGQAGMLVGTGAGLMNMVFSPPGTKVLQFQDPDHIVHALWTMAAAMGFGYHYMSCEPVENPGGANDIRVPLEELEASLNAMTATSA